MKYVEIYARLSLAADCMIADIETDERDPEGLAEVGEPSWELRTDKAIAAEIGEMIAEHFLEVEDESDKEKEYSPHDILWG